MTALRKADPAKYIVRGPYDQHPGYAPWCVSVEDRLNENPPRSACELVERSAEYMRDRQHESWRRIGAEGRETLLALEDINLEVFGPAEEELFGVINVPRKWFHTPAGWRGYRATLVRNYPGEAEKENEASFRARPFSYPIPDTDRELPLLRLEYSPQDGLGFFHPSFSEQYYADFIACLEPQFATVHNKAVPVDERRKAALTFYWLMAQATPSVRGGSAQARITLHHLAPFADLEVPYMNKDYDLWAEAASSYLPDFIRRYRDKDSPFFDRKVTDDEILEWQRQRIRETVCRALPQAEATVRAIEPDLPPLDIDYLPG